MYTVHAICQFALEFYIFWCQLGIGFLVGYFLHLAENFAFLVVVIAVVGDIAVALLPSLPPSRLFGLLISEGRESDCAAGLERSYVRKVYLTRAPFGGAGSGLEIVLCRLEDADLLQLSYLSVN